MVQISIYVVQSNTPIAQLSLLIDTPSPIYDTWSVAAFVKTRAYADWVSSLKDHKARALILARVDKFEESGHPGDARPVGENVTEMRIHFGPGYRVYYTELKQTIILLGGDKSTQKTDVREAQKYAKIWRERLAK